MRSSPEAQEIARRFNLLLDRFPHPDPKRRRWKDTELAAAAGGGLSRMWVSGLRRGHYANPGLHRLSLIAEVMGFPVELWHLDPEDWDTALSRRLCTTDGLCSSDLTILRSCRQLTEEHKEVVVAVAQRLAALQSAGGK